MESFGEETATIPARPAAKRYVALLVITAAVALATGVVLRQPTLMAANDISRWCTVWSLLERGSYIIDECPWQRETQDKVYLPQPGAGPDAPRHYYSSKPALLSTLIAGALYPARLLSGVPLDRLFLQEREPRWVQKHDETAPGKVKGVIEKPTDPVKWPAYLFYFKPVLLLLNILPFCLFLVLFARLLDRQADNDWAWFYSLVAAAFGTYLLPFTQTLNNHTVAAFSVFFALYQFVRIWDEPEPSAWRFAVAGFFASFAAVNELPAASFLALLLLFLFTKFPTRTLTRFALAALIPLLAFMAAQYAALGAFKLAYEDFGKQAYLYEGSFWKSPLELDALNVPWTDSEEAARRGIPGESRSLYLFHMTLGHHGFWSLTPIFLISLAGLFRLLPGGGRSMSPVAWMTLVLTVVAVGFYAWTTKARNYGGSTQGLRWLFWLIPFWLMLLPKGVEAGHYRRGARFLALFLLAVSVISVGYAMRNPWSHPWILDALEHLDIYPLPR